MSRRRRQATPCPTASKTGYPDELTAKIIMARILVEPGPARAKLPVRAYRCRCGRWHLTSQPLA